MTRSRAVRLTAAGAAALACCLALAILALAPGGPAGRPPRGGADPSAARPVSGGAPPAGTRPPSGQRGGRAGALTARETFAACEHGLQPGPRPTPRMAIVGASYTAGTGPGNPALAWSTVLARLMHWNAAIYGVSGAGYVNAGADHLGPVRRLLAAERLHALDPSLVIVQAGFNDGRKPAARVRRRVRQAVKLIRAEAPRARIALLTVFTVPGRRIPARFYRTDRTIVSAGRAADPGVIIMDPLRGKWRFQHVRDGHGLHPTAAGDAWIARKVRSILRGHGIASAAPTVIPPVTCDVSITHGQAKHPRHAGERLAGAGLACCRRRLQVLSSGHDRAPRGRP